MRASPFLLCLLVAAAPSLGQAQTVPTPSEQITIVAPYLLKQREIKTNPRQRLLAASLEGRVSYADLDLSRSSDVATLEARIHDTARSLCGQLEKSYPSRVYVPVSGQDCAKSAADQAMFAVKFMIDFWHAR